MNLNDVSKGSFTQAIFVVQLNAIFVALKLQQAASVHVIS